MPVQHAPARRITLRRVAKPEQETVVDNPAAPAKRLTRGARSMVRGRVGRPAAAKPDYLEQIDEILQSIAQCDASLREVATARDNAVAAIAKLMHDNEVTGEVIAHGYRAAIEETMSRASVEIDAGDLYAYLKKMGKQDDFWDVVKPQVGEVKKLLSEREFVKLPKTTVDAKKTGERIVVEPIKVKGRTK